MACGVRSFVLVCRSCHKAQAPTCHSKRRWLVCAKLQSIFTPATLSTTTSIGGTLYVESSKRHVLVDFDLAEIMPADSTTPIPPLVIG